VLLAVVFFSSGTVKSLGSKDWFAASGQTGVACLSIIMGRVEDISPSSSFLCLVDAIPTTDPGV
jgi:hypothetical protein